MDFDYFSPFVRRAADSVVQSDMRLRHRVIFDYELVYIKSGELEFAVEDDVYKCVPGDIIFLQPRITHSLKSISKGPLHQPHVHFDLFYQPDSPAVPISFRPLSRIQPNEMNYFRPFLTIPGIGEPPAVLRLENSSVFEHKLFALIREYNSHLPYSDIAVKGLFTDLWIYYLREVYLSRNEIVRSTMTAIMLVRDYLDAHLYENVTLDELSAYVHLSKYYISRVFRKVYGMPPMHYHQIARINKAKELVQFSNMSISRIAENMGYANVNSFSRAFKAVEKVPPLFYR